MTEKFAFVFPGQGSQAIGMCAALLDDFPAVAQRFSIANDILGYDIAALMADGPIEELNKTTTTQPAMLVASIATWDAWRDCGGPLPNYMAGHSFGEYCALVCANSISFEDAVFLAAERGRFMQEAVPADRSAVCAVLGLDEDVLDPICASAAQGQVVQCANINAPGQIVLTGDRDAVQRACKLALDAGARKVIPLAVSAPVHCALMLPAAERLANHIKSINIAMPDIPIIHNVDAKPRANVDDIRAALIAQMASPVRWRDTVEYFVENDIRTTIECGPGKVLSALVKRTSKAIKTLPISSRASIDSAIGGLQSTNKGGNNE
ncbi:MAG: [acyl-carrier-protein] S-malonyltransferase [Gammaproteobacteria bacterium]|jgi:[acyl-carrier-protein] S-malonyltransferase